MFELLDPTTEIALFIGVMSGITILLIGAAFASGVPRQFSRRLHDVAAHRAPAERGGKMPMRSLSRRGSATPGIDRIFRMLPRREALVERLEKTGYRISIGQYMLATLGAMLAVSLLFVVFAGFGLMASLLFGIAIGGFVPHYIAGRIGQKRVARFIGLFPEAIDLMVRALRSGLPVTEAMINAGQEIGDPVGTEFRDIEAGMRLGRDLDSLLWDIARRITAPEFRFFIIALSVQRETGGNLAETLNNLSDVLRRRRAMRAKARAMASEARASTMILGSLPIIVAGILSVTSPSYIMPLFTDVRGLILVGIGFAMLATGVTVMVKMAQFEI
jgi:tight adherence protein B